MHKNNFFCSSGWYSKTLHHTLKITWCVISLLAHHISKQRNEPLGTDKSCQNRPIIGYTSVWSTGTSFCLSLTGVPSLLHPLLLFSAYISLHWPHDLNAWNRVPWVWQFGAATILIQIPIQTTIQWFSPDITDFSIYGHLPYWSPSSVKFT